jgi:hypothetical protein
MKIPKYNIGDTVLSTKKLKRVIKKVEEGNEKEDGTTGSRELACTSDACEVVDIGEVA